MRGHLSPVGALLLEQGAQRGFFSADRKICSLGILIC